MDQERPPVHGSETAKEQKGEDPDVAGVVKLFLERLDTFFRYFLPGFVILGAAYCAYPSWFGWVKLSEASDAIFMFSLSLVVGAVAYTLHRFSVHQLLDVACWWCNGPAANPPANPGANPPANPGANPPAKTESYRDYLVQAVQNGVPKKEIKHHIAVRSSQLILLFLSVEAFFLFNSLPPECDSVFNGWGWWLRCRFGLVLIGVFGFAIWEYWLVNYLDRKLKRPAGDTDEPTNSTSDIPT
jgi:hypothetical protein